MSIHLTRIYTRTGDAGKTSLSTGERVSKTHPRLEAYGTLDELNAFLGKLAYLCSDISFDSIRKKGGELAIIQSSLFDIGTLLSTPSGQSWPGMPVLEASATEQLEQWMDQMNSEIPALNSFVLPGGCALNAEAHICRTVCRRLERQMVGLQESGESVDSAGMAYINRLSDYLFVFSRWVSHKSGTPEVLWKPNR